MDRVRYTKITLEDFEVIISRWYPGFFIPELINNKPNLKVEKLMHKSSYDDTSDFVNSFLDSNKKTLIADVGSYDVNGCLRPLFQNSKWKYVGLDISSGPNVDIVLESEYGWGSKLNEMFDIVVSGQVLEHTRMPWKWILDIAQITKIGGIIYIIAPHTWEYHEYPIDCWRADGIKALMEYAGLNVIKCYRNSNDTIGIAKKINNSPI